MIRIFWAAMVCLAVDVAGYWPSFDPEPTESRLLQGRWEIVSVSRDGQIDPTHLGATLAFAGDNVKFEPRFLTWNGVTYTIVQDQPLGSVFTSTLWDFAEQGAPPRIADGTS